MPVTVLTAADAAPYRALMLHAYEHAADAFTSTAQERAREPDTWWVRRIADPEGMTIAFGAFEGAELAGTVALEFSPKPKTRHKALVVGMYVRPGCRRQGLARALMQAAIDHCIGRADILVVQLEVTQGNAPAVLLYEQLGFEAFGIEPLAMRMPGGFRAKVHMWLNLSERRKGADLPTTRPRQGLRPDSTSTPQGGAMQPTLRRIQLHDASAFHACLDAVARERKYLAQVQAPPLEDVRKFVAQSVEQDAAQYVADLDGRIVGWCDVFAHWAYALKHVGTLGMGIEAGFRGQGLGRALILKTLDHALGKGIFRVTLEAREDNTPAIRLYERVGFQHEGRAPCALRFDGVFHAGVKMALLQGDARRA